MLKVSLEQGCLFMLLYQLQAFLWNIVTGVCLYLDTVQYISRDMWRGCITENRCWIHSHVHLFFPLGTDDTDGNQICAQNAHVSCSVLF